MEKNLKLTIEKKKYTGESKVISLRIPQDMLEDIDDIAEKTGHSRNEILQKCMEFALEHMDAK